MKKTVVTAIFVICFAASFACAQEDTERKIDVTAKVDRDTISIGDRIKLDVIAEKPAGIELSFPESFKDLGEFTLVDSRPISKGRREGREYIMSIYTTGTHVIPPLSVGYKKPEDIEWRVAQSPQVPVEVLSVLTGEDTDIRGLKGILKLGRKLYLYVLAAALLLIAGGLSWYLWKKRARDIETAAMRRKTAYETAYEQLKKLRAMDLPGQGKIQEYYTRLSDIIRRYLESRFSLRAPEMTTEEFLAAVRNSSVLVDAHKDLLKEFLSKCDMVKFAKYGPTPIEMLDSFKAAENLLEQTRPVEEEEEEE